jgi:predicted dehydrogenase
VKVAIIGAGNNAAGHAKSLAAIDDVQVVGVADPMVDRAEALVTDVGGTAYDDHRALLEGEKPDAVWVCSPCFLHAQQTIDCAEAGAHVMCEKPMALSLADCDLMIATAKDTGVKIMVDQSTRFMPALLELKRILDSGRCGDFVKSWSIRESYHHIKNQANWRLDFDKSGGIVFEWEVHEIDFVRSMGGDVTDVYARIAYSREEAPTFLDHFSAILTFANGGFGNLEASQSQTISSSGRGFTGTKGSAVAVGRDTVRVQTADMVKPEDITVETDPGTEQGLGRLTPNTAFIEAIRNDGPSPVPGEEGRTNIAIACAIVESGQTGKVVPL